MLKHFKEKYIENKKGEIFMDLIREELEQEANNRILEDMKGLLNKYASGYMDTSAFMIINKCVDELVYVEQYSRLQELKAI